MSGHVAGVIGWVIHRREYHRAKNLVEAHLEQYRSTELIATLEGVPRTRREIKEERKNAKLEMEKMQLEGVEFRLEMFELPSPVRRWLAGGVLAVDEFYLDVGQSEVFAFWVRDGHVYSANEAARALSPELPTAGTVISVDVLASELKEISICDVPAYP